jgi:hypothetical protein
MAVIDAVDRPDPPTVGDEREILLSMLDYYRATLLTKCQGLDHAQLERRSVEPSELSLMELLRHLAGAERYWFQICLLGRSLQPLYLRTEDGEIDPSDPSTPAEVVQRFATACEESRQAVAPLSFDHVVGSGVMGQPVNLRYICVHMLEEYARHCGHADLLRERIDGAVGD